jgi:hypothetical protein
MKYIIRLIALPFWIVVFLIFSIFTTIRNLFTMCFDFVVYGGEQITYSSSLNRYTIFKTFLKLEKIEVNSQTDPRSQCNHIWQDLFSSPSTSIKRQKCTICGAETGFNNFFTK